MISGESLVGRDNMDTGAGASTREAPALVCATRGSRPSVWHRGNPGSENLFPGAFEARGHGHHTFWTEAIWKSVTENPARCFL